MPSKLKSQRFHNLYYFTLYNHLTGFENGEAILELHRPRSVSRFFIGLAQNVVEKAESRVRNSIEPSGSPPGAHTHRHWTGALGLTHETAIRGGTGSSLSRISALFIRFSDLVLVLRDGFPSNSQQTP
jgi:hypothetical protein